MTILQEFHGAVLEVRDNYMKYIDQGLVEVLVRRCCEGPAAILSEVLAWSCAGPYDKILRRSCWHPQRGLAPVLLRRSYGDPGEVLSAVRGFCMILYRSLSEDLAEILVRSYLRGPCVKILQMPYMKGACMKDLLGCSWEVLLSRSCKILSGSSRSFYDDLVGFS